MKIILNCEVKEETLNAMADQLGEKFDKTHIDGIKSVLTSGNLNIDLDELFGPMMPMVVNFAMQFIKTKEQTNNN